MGEGGTGEIKLRVTAVIPARMGSSRFPGKPLKKILGLPMVEHVRRRALLCKSVDEVIVATCDDEIMTAIAGYGGKAVMTKDTHERCTDRVEEAVQNDSSDIVVILQGDEPLLVAEVIDHLIAPLKQDPEILCANLVSIIHDQKDLADPDIVKAVIDQKGNVLCFSRAGIPYHRTEADCPIYRQTGLSAFRKSFLQKFSKLSPTPLEIIESVDFMRILEHGYPIRAGKYL